MESLPVALLIAVVVSLGVQMTRVDWLTKAIGIVVLLTAVGLLAAPRLVSYARGRRIGESVRFKAVQLPLTIAAGATLGVFVSLTSVGAGALPSSYDPP